MKPILILSIFLVGILVGRVSHAEEINKTMNKEWDSSWKSPKDQPYFDSALHVNDTGKDLVCSVCGGVVHSIKNKPHKGIYTQEMILKLNPGYENYEVKT